MDKGYQIIELDSNYNFENNSEKIEYEKDVVLNLMSANKISINTMTTEKKEIDLYDKKELGLSIIVRVEDLERVKEILENDERIEYRIDLKDRLEPIENITEDFNNDPIQNFDDNNDDDDLTKNLNSQLKNIAILETICLVLIFLIIVVVQMSSMIGHINNNRYIEMILLFTVMVFELLIFIFILIKKGKKNI